MAADPAQSDVGLKERFYLDFQRDVSTLQTQIESLSTSSDGSDRNDAIDSCLAGIDRLSHDVKDASSYIPAYDQRSYSLTLKLLSEKLQNTRNSFNPPKKFSFKSRKNAPAASGSNRADSSLSKNPAGSDTAKSESFAPNLLVSKEEKVTQGTLGHVEEDVKDGIQDGPGVRRPSLSDATKVAITNHSNLHVKLPAAASHATSSGTVSNLQRCMIDLSAPTTKAPFSALYLKNIKDSLITCGQTAGAVHITDVENSVLVISCRQFRMHGSKKVDVYLHSASRPIIEDCAQVRFAPMPQVLSTPAMLEVTNHWDQIDDFKWLKAEASPNFSLLAESERVKDEVWTDEVMGSEELVGVLKVVGVQ